LERELPKPIKTIIKKIYTIRLEMHTTRNTKTRKRSQLAR